MNEGRVTGAIFLDLKKAFDVVSHRRLLKKLHSYGITGHMLQWFELYLKNRCQAVNINSTLSDFKDITLEFLKDQYKAPFCSLFFLTHYQIQ